MEISLTSAQALLEQGKYREASDVALACMSETLDRKETMLAHLIVAKSFLARLPLGASRSTVKDISDMIVLACDRAEMIEEIWEIERDVNQTILAWEIECIQKSLIEIENNPTINGPSDYTKATCVRNEMLLHLSPICFAPAYPLVKQFCEEKGIDGKTYTDEYRPKYPWDELHETTSSLERESALRIFTKAKRDLASSSSIFNAEQMKAVFANVLLRLTVSDLLMDGVHRSKTCPTNIRVLSLKDHIEILTFFLNARFTFNGSTALLLSDNDSREREKSKRQKLFQELTQYEANYTLPPLETFTPTKSGGGCYVATAVYGSYDCPEVWTLRRYRDNTLAKTWYGRAFIHTYYAISPTLVKWFGNTSWFKKLWKGKLDRMVKALQENGYDSTPYVDRKW